MSCDHSLERVACMLLPCMKLCRVKRVGINVGRKSQNTRIEMVLFYQVLSYELSN